METIYSATRRGNVSSNRKYSEAMYRARGTAELFGEAIMTCPRCFPSFALHDLKVSPRHVPRSGRSLRLFPSTLSWETKFIKWLNSSELISSVFWSFKDVVHSWQNNRVNANIINFVFYIIYPCFSANSRALCSLTTRLSSRSDLFPQRIMSGSSQYAWVYRYTNTNQRSNKGIEMEWKCLFKQNMLQYNARTRKVRNENRPTTALILYDEIILNRQQ